MDVSKITQEQFSAVLRDRSIAEIYSLVEGYGAALPAGITDKSELLSVAYEAISARPAPPSKSSGPAPVGAPRAVSTSDSARPPAPPKPAGAGRRFKVRCKMGIRWRAGRQWSNAYQTVMESEFSAAEWAILRADASIQVIELPR